MRRQLLVLSTLLLIAAASYLAGTRFPEKPDIPELNGFYRVMQVHDGDTIAVLLDGTRVSVRLIGIDSPEVETPYTRAECFGAEASRSARALLDGKMVRLETDPTQQMFDIYDRLLAYVYVQDESAPGGILVNRYMLENGFAREYTYRDPYVHHDAFVAAQSDAKAQKKGMWGACAS